MGSLVGEWGELHRMKLSCVDGCWKQCALLREARRDMSVARPATRNPTASKHASKKELASKHPDCHPAEACRAPAAGRPGPEPVRCT